MSRIKKTLEDAQNVLKNLQFHSINDALFFVDSIEKATRLEIGKKVVEFLSNPNLVNALIEVAELYGDNEEILEKTLWSLSQISTRGFWAIRQYNDYNYDFDSVTPKIYNLFLKYRNIPNNDGIRLTISEGIIELPEFEEFPEKWEYIISLANIVPQKKSLKVFRYFVGKNIENIPDNIKDSIRIILNSYLDETSLDITTRKLYEDTVSRIE